MIKVKNCKKLKVLMMKSGYNASSFARTINMSQQSISKLLSGERNPSPKTAYKIKETLNVDWDDLFIIPEVN